MNFFFILFLTTFFIEHGAFHEQILNNGPVKTTRGNHESWIDILTEDLMSHNWSEDERPCLNQILKTIINVKNSTLWATWLWDSNQLPVGQLMGSKHHLGSYDQCLSEIIGSSLPPFRTKYCLADVVLNSNKEPKVKPQDVDPYGPTEEYVNSQTEWKRRFNVLTWGVCVPRTCQKESVKKILYTLLRQSHLGRLQLQPKVTIENCELAGEASQYVDGFNIIVVAAFIMTLVGLSCTKYISERQKVNPNNSALVYNTIKCFCLKRNANDLMSSPRDDIKALNGMRFLSSCIVVLVHSVMICMIVTSRNSLNLEKDLNSYGLFILNLVIVVDTFFIMSGLLFVKNIKDDSTLWDLAKLLIKRYFRLIWWYVASLVTIIFILPRFGCGPLCAKFMDLEQGACTKSWWLGLLMIANYVDRTNICHPASWYIFSDFHLTLTALILFWIHQKNPRIGKICFGILAFLSILLPGILAYNWPELGDNPFHFQLYDVLRNCKTSVFFLSYLRTHNRASPYFVGLILGYILKNYGANAFRNNLTKKQFFTGVLAFVATVVYLSMWSYNLKVMLIIVLHRLIWAFIICSIIVLCENGSLPTVNKFLSWPIFVPLSKLTYGMYMVHSITIMYNTTSIRSPLHFNGYILTEKFLGNLTLACFLSLFFLLFIEAPLNNLVKLMLNSFGNTEHNIEANNKNNVDEDKLDASADKTLSNCKDKQL